MIPAVTTFKDVKSKLEYIQKNLKEEVLYPTLVQLFRQMGFEKVEVTHGAQEYGRDLVFCTKDSLGESEWWAVVVKNRNAGQADFLSSGEINRQIEMSFKMPWIAAKGEKYNTTKVLVVVNGAITHNAKEILAESSKELYWNNVILWNYQRLEESIEQNIKELFLSGETGTQDEYEVNLYRSKIGEELASLGNAKQLFMGFESISEIDDIFVNVRTAEKRFEAERQRYSDVTLRQATGEVDDAIAILNSNKHTIITGIPTAGKTMLLKRIGLKALRNHDNIGVFWFSMRDIEPATFDIQKSICDQFASYTGGAAYKGDSFAKIILLFDALDEVVSDQSKREIILKIREYIDKETKTRVIITGRELDIFDDVVLFGDFEKVNLLPFDVGQALSLVSKIIPGDKSKNNKFISAIRKQQLSSDLIRTPMALTLMAIMYNDNSIDLDELPANVTELFSKFSDYYLDKWDATKGLSSQYKYEQVKNIMGFIAYEMQSLYKSQISSKELKECLVRIGSTHSIEELKDVDAYIQQLKERDTLLSYDSHNDVFYFAGGAFQEYFTSIYYDDSTEEELLGYAYNDWWQNVIVFYNGRSPKRTVFVKKLMTNPVPLDGKSLYNHMHLLSKCLQAAHMMPNDVKKAGILNIIDAFEYFYKTIFIPIENGQTIAYAWNTLDVILQFRKLFETLFMSRHIEMENFQEVAQKVLDAGFEKYSDVTLYCVSYHMFLHGNLQAFEQFLQLPYNTRWDRIISRDIQMRKLEKELPPKVYNRIKRKQHSNKNYIDQQFKESAILHLLNGTKLIELKE